MKIIHFKQQSGREPIREYILSLPKADAAQVLASLEDIEENGLDKTLVVLKPIEGKLWEVKLPVHRILYVLISGPTMVLLHAIKKKDKSYLRKIENLLKSA